GVTAQLTSGNGTWDMQRRKCLMRKVSTILLVLWAALLTIIHISITGADPIDTTYGRTERKSTEMVSIFRTSWCNTPQNFLKKTALSRFLSIGLSIFLITLYKGKIAGWTSIKIYHLLEINMLHMYLPWMKG